MKEDITWYKMLAIILSVLSVVTLTAAISSNKLSNALPYSVVTFESITSAGVYTITSDYPFNNHACQIIWSGTPTAIIGAVEGSIDGTKFATLGTFSVSAANTGTTVFVVDKAAAALRMNVSALYSATLATANIYCISSH